MYLKKGFPKKMIIINFDFIYNILFLMKTPLHEEFIPVRRVALSSFYLKFFFLNEICSGLQGKLLEVNERLMENPTLINTKVNLVVLFTLYLLFSFTFDNAS